MSSNRNLFQEFLVASLAVLISLSLFTFVLGLPWNTFGLWKQTESATLSLHILSGLIVLVLGVLVTTKDETTIAAFVSKPVLYIYALIGLSFLLLPFTDYPTRSLHGTMKHGEGILWFLDLAVLTIGSTIVMQSRHRFMPVFFSVVSAICITALYQFEPQTGLGVPLGFLEWVGLAVALSVVPLITTTWQTAMRYPAVGLAFGLLGWSYHVSQNRAVLLAVIAVGAMSLLKLFPAGKAWIQSPRFRAGSVIVVTLLGAVCLYFAAPMIEKYRLSSLPAGETESVLSNDPRDRYDLHMGALGTIWSRSYMVRIVVSEIANEPLTFLTGKGFGGFETVYEKHAREVPGRMLVESNSTTSAAYWDSHAKSNFHPHNMPIDMLYSTGVLGLFAWVGLFAAIARTSEAGFLASLALSVFFTFWFPVNHVTGLLALFIAAFVVLPKVGDRTVYYAVNLAPLLFVATLGFAVSSFLFARTMLVETNEKSFETVTTGHNPKTCSVFRLGPFPEPEIATTLYTLLQRTVAFSKDPGQEIYNKTTNFIALSCMIRNYQAHRPEIVSLMFSLKNRAKFAHFGPQAYGGLSKDLVEWPNDLDLLLKIAPGRTDQIAPYITELARRVPAKAVHEIDRYVALLSDSDPIKDYLMFVRAKLNGNKEDQARHIQNAVDKGFANIFLVEDASVKEFNLK